MKYQVLTVFLTLFLTACSDGSDKQSEAEVVETKKAETAAVEVVEHITKPIEKAHDTKRLGDARAETLKKYAEE